MLDKFVDKSVVGFASHAGVFPSHVQRIYSVAKRKPAKPSQAQLELGKRGIPEKSKWLSVPTSNTTDKMLGLVRAARADLSSRLGLPVGVQPCAKSIQCCLACRNP